MITWSERTQQDVAYNRHPESVQRLCDWLQEIETKLRQFRTVQHEQHVRLIEQYRFYHLDPMDIELHVQNMRQAFTFAEVVFEDAVTLTDAMNGLIEQLTQLYHAERANYHIAERLSRYAQSRDVAVVDDMPETEEHRLVGIAENGSRVLDEGTRPEWNEGEQMRPEDGEPIQRQHEPQEIAPQDIVMQDTAPKTPKKKRERRGLRGRKKKRSENTTK